MSRLSEQDYLDLHDVLRHEYGFRFMCRILNELGVNTLMCSENDMRMRNIADQFINDVAKAHPEAYVRIMCELKNIPFCVTGEGETHG